ncbi:hypothetical protein SY88_12700 [Clostridiales bacterium PH28_bin88]|nr:hypothetical protein SY88_12700 [Clostridiales bacterium PH28_bin88]
MCFGCGRDNPIGLKLSFHREGELFYSEYVPPDHFQGYPGVLHGGIVSTLLDEVMANHLYTQGKRVVTADLYVRYKKPVPTGKPLRIVSRLKMARKRFFELEGWIEDTDGQVLAEGRAKMMEMEGNRVESQ